MTSNTHTGAETHSHHERPGCRPRRPEVDRSCAATVTRGHITLLLGHNGAGKTVLMNCLHGLMTVDLGHIDAPPQKRQKMVFQKPIMLRRSAGQYLKSFVPSLIHNSFPAGWHARAVTSHRYAGACPVRWRAAKLALIGALPAVPTFSGRATAHLDFEATTIEVMILDAHADGTSILMTAITGHRRNDWRRMCCCWIMVD